jgi:hypothetical protein
VTALTQSLWPSSICISGLQADGTFGNLHIHPGIWSLNIFLITIVSGAKIIAEEYSWRGAVSIIHRHCKTKRLAS